MTKKNPPKKRTAGIQLGSRVKDLITGFTGIAVARTEFGFGCVHIHIQAQGLTTNGEPIPVQRFDDQRVEVLEAPTKSWPVPKKTTIRLGDMVRDVLTGASGVVSAKMINLDGRVNIIIEQPGLTEDRAPIAPLCVSLEGLIVVDRRELEISKDSVATSGGPITRRVVSSAV